jgi:restriction endonuclease Mrr
LLVVFGLGLLFEHGRDDACLGSFCFVFGLFALRHWFKIDDAEEAYLKAHFIKVSLLRNECAKLEKSLAGSKSKTLEKYQNDHENYLSAQRDWEHFETRKQKALARKEKDYWLKMDGLKFEKEFASLLRRNGFSAKATKPSGDEGIDIVGTLEGEPLVVQCKAWKNPVGAPDMRNFLGSWDHHNGKKGKAWLVGLSGFNAGARKVAKKAGIKLIDVDDVIELAESAQ